MDMRGSFCPSCGRENPAGSAFCNSCGGHLPPQQPVQPQDEAPPSGAPADRQRDRRPVPRRRGNRRLLLLGLVAAVIVVVIVVAVLFGGDKKTEGAGAKTTAAADASDPIKQKWGGVADLGDLLVTVSAPVDDTANVDEWSWTEGEKNIYCMVTITNNGDEAYSYNGLAFTMYDREGLSYDSFGTSSKQT
jgi:hypothetical protein